jgi:hypothetical protein
MSGYTLQSDQRTCTGIPYKIICKINTVVILTKLYLHTSKELEIKETNDRNRFLEYMYISMCHLHTDDERGY